MALDELKFEAVDKPIKEVLFSHYKFRVPRFQRPYAWTEDQVSEFWNDLNNEADSFFIGSFILNYENLQSEGFLEIIDGQQRILTLTILLGALRDIAKGIDTETSSRYQRQNIALEDWSGQLTFRIQCGDSAQEFFQTYIQEAEKSILEAIPDTREEKRIKENYEYFYSRILEEVNSHDKKSEKLKILNTIRDKIGDLTVIHIKIQNEEDAYEIFETTNARGVDLNVADLLKNLVFKNIKPKGNKDIAKEKWATIESNILTTETEVKRFLRYFWISKHSFATEKQLFREIKRDISDWDKFLSGLLDASEQYLLLLTGDLEDWKDWGVKNADRIHKSISAIRQMGVSQCYVLFLSILRNYDNLKTDPSRIFELIERFTFNYSVLSKFPGNRVEKIYARYAQRLETIVATETPKKIAGKVNSLFSQLENELREERPPKELFVEFFRELRYKNSEQGRVIVKYVLSEINNFYATTNEHKIDFENVNVEHLIPQKPDNSWKLGKGDIAKYVNLLGNLTLIDKRINSTIGNRSITEKIAHLKKSELPITKKLLDDLSVAGGKWGEKEVILRQQKFAELGYSKIWNY